MDKVKLAVVGCGGIANWHFDRVKHFPDVEYVGFCDTLTERAERMRDAAGGGKIYRDVDVVRMYDETKPDALHICVPPAQHGLIEFEAIKRGIHMLVQKPISCDLNLAIQIDRAITANNIITSVGFQDRYLDLVEYMKEFLKGKEIGLISGAWVGGIPGVEWWRRRSTSGGQIVEQNIHLFDMLRYLIGEPVSVYTAAGKGIVKPEGNPALEGYDVEDYSATVVRFKNGAIANIFTGDYVEAGGGMQNGLTFYAKDATLDYDLRTKITYTDRLQTTEVFQKEDQGMPLDREFIDAVKTGDTSKIRSSYSDALKSLRFTMATNDSIDTGKVVLLDL